LIRRTYVAPRNQTEQVLVQIWKEILGLEQLGIKDDFFELGGHSLLIGQLINRVSEQLNQRLSYKDFFSAPSIEGMATHLRQSSFQPIPKVVAGHSYPITSAQERLWVLSQLEGGSQAYNMLVSLLLEGELKKEHLLTSFRHLIGRYEVLRTHFGTDDNGELRQFVLDVSAVNFTIAETDCSKKEEEDIRAHLEQLNREAFALETAPLLRAELIQLEENKHILFLSLHHLIADGWSLQLLKQEIVRTYNKLCLGQKLSDGDVDLQYKDYVVWEKAQTKTLAHQEARQYWLDQFSGDLPVLELPSFRPRPAVQTYNGAQLNRKFNASFLEQMKSFSRQEGATVFMSLLASIKALLYRYSGQRDLIVGSPVAGRDHPQLEQQLGLFVNTLALRTQLKERGSFTDLLQTQKEQLLEAYGHQSYPFSKLVNELPLQRDSSRSALFDVMVVWQNQEQLHQFQSTGDMQGLEASQYPFDRPYTQFDLSFFFAEQDGELTLCLTYNTDIYDRNWMEQLLDHWHTLTQQLLEEPQKDLDAHSYLGATETSQLLEGFNQTAIAYPTHKTILDFFREQVQKTPRKIALVFQEEQLTFKGLDERSNQLAHYLLARGVKGEELVPICLDRSLEMMVAILGILKVGAAYVPIDPSFPTSRIQFILEDCEARLVLTHSQFSKHFDDQIACFLDELPLERESAKAVQVEVLPRHLAYAIYTSGTTGQPKGVLNQHAGLMNRLLWMRDDLNITGDDVLLQKTTYTFDVSVWELTMFMLSGSRLVFADPEGHKDPDYLREIVEEERVNLVHFVPSMLGVFLENVKPKNCQSLRHIVCSGEALPAGMVAQCKQLLPDCRIHNYYGPTEAAIDVSAIDLTEID
ncbi:MAG: condensation domain-containing protein, partial [Bacteroidota bacterium]